MLRKSHILNDENRNVAEGEKVAPKHDSTFNGNLSDAIHKPEEGTGKKERKSYLQVLTGSSENKNTSKKVSFAESNQMRLLPM